MITRFVCLSNSQHQYPAFDDAQPCMQLAQLGKSFLQGIVKRQVLREISATFAAGEFVALFGQSGKHTRLKLISDIAQKR